MAIHLSPTGEALIQAHPGNFSLPATISYGIGTAPGPLFTSLVFQYTVDYRIAFICLLALYAISAPAALMIKKAYIRQRTILMATGFEFVMVQALS